MLLAEVFKRIDFWGLDFLCLQRFWFCVSGTLTLFSVQAKCLDMRDQPIAAHSSILLEC